MNIFSVVTQRLTYLGAAGCGGCFCLLLLFLVIHPLYTGVSVSVMYTVVLYGWLPKISNLIWSLRID